MATLTHKPPSPPPQEYILTLSEAELGFLYTIVGTSRGGTVEASDVFRALDTFGEPRVKFEAPTSALVERRS